MTADLKRSFTNASLSLYRETLLLNVVPFWLRHGVDRDFGGISNVLDDDATVMGHDKYLWSQGRALWTFSALYNRIEKRPEWLAFAHHIYDYLRTHGRDPEGRWMYRLDKQGIVLDRDISIYVDGFVINGLGEYHLATGEPAALQVALDTWANVQRRLACPGSYGTAPYNIPPGLKTHGIAMVYSMVAYNLGEIADSPQIKQAGLAMADEVLNQFYNSDKDAILEFVTLDGRFVDEPVGRACVPGHSLESLWFLVSIFERTGDADRIQECCRLIKRHLELGWDAAFGGLSLALDIESKQPVGWDRAPCKPWWVQVEALVATAYAHLYTGEAWCLDWHQKIQAWAFAHYPVATGEWTQWVDREGRKMEGAVLPVKDPFHLPRALMVLIDLLQRPEFKRATG